MNENVENLILTQLRELREGQRNIGDKLEKGLADVSGEVAELRQMIGGQGVILTSIAGYVHQVENRVEKLEGADE
ncbi:MAG: hypothetical protein AAGE03_11180 [Pseudomonadota bacterium]